MTRMINDYIDRFYNPEKKRSTALKADDFKLAKEIVAWKESVVEKWNGINVVSLDIKEANPNLTGEKLDVTAVIDTNGIGKDLGLEYVSYRVEDGVEHLYETKAVQGDKDRWQRSDIPSRRESSRYRRIPLWIPSISDQSQSRTSSGFRVRTLDLMRP